MGKSYGVEAMGMPLESQRSHLKDYLSLLKRRFWIVFLVLFGITAATAAFSFLTTPVYRATTRILIHKPSSAQGDPSPQGNVESRGKTSYKAQYKLLRDRELALKVIETLSLGAALGFEEMVEADKSAMVDQYLESLKIEPLSKKQVVTISYTGNSPQLTAKVANTHARLFIETHPEVRLAKVPVSQAFLSAGANGEGQNSGLSGGNVQLAALMRKAKTNKEINDQLLLKQAMARSRAEAMKHFHIRVIEYAKPPEQPIRPNKMLNMTLAVFAGLFLGVGLAILTENKDHSMKEPVDVQLLDLPVLAKIPKDRKLRNVHRFLPEDPGSAFPNENNLSPYELPISLFNALKKSENEKEGRVILFESAKLGEGKSTVVGNLAVSLAKKGLRAVLVDCDFNNPTLNSIFKKENASGLQEVMKSVLAVPLDRGTLQEFSVGDLFFLAALNRFSGQLMITNSPFVDFHDLMKELGRIDGAHTSGTAAQVMRISFDEGRLVQIDDQFSPQENRIGTVLHKEGVITRDQMMDALVRNKCTGLPLGYILINQGYIKREDLQGPLRNQMEENLYKVFNWRTGTFSFESNTPESKEKEGVCIEEDFTGQIENLTNLFGSTFIEKLLTKSLTALSEPHLYLLNNTDGQNGNEPQCPDSVKKIRMIARFLNILKRRFDVVLVDTPPLFDSSEMTRLATVADGAIFLVKAGNISLQKIQEARRCIEEGECAVIGAVLNQVKGG